MTVNAALKQVHKEKIMVSKYKNILTPVKIGNVVLKNRLLSAKCVPSHLDDFAALTAFYEGLARNGAATVTVAVGTYPDCEGKRNPMARLHMDDPDTQSFFASLVECIHDHGTLASASLMGIEPQDVAISDTPNWDEIPRTGDYSRNFSNKPGISEQRLEGLIEDFVFQCREFKRIGFDMVTIYMSYRGSILACSLSPLLNQRTDRYGGKTMKERATLSLEIFRRIKEACGSDFLIEAQISATEEAPGYTLEDCLDYCELCEGLVDIFQFRGWEGSTTHGNGYNSIKGRPYNLQFAEAFKKRGIKALVSPVGTFGNPDDIERFISEGRTDLVSMARTFIADENYGLKLVEERGEDVVPCLLCNSCHDGFCSVNPKAGYYHILDTMYKKPEYQKKVAVIGGGPAGMKAALVAKERGHCVTLFEKSDKLGGQLNIADHAYFKWPVRDYKNWLISEVYRAGIDLCLSTPALPEVIRDEGYEAIICALGSRPTILPIKGADSDKIWDAEKVFGRESELGERVVVIGGAASGREAALYLACCGHKVIMLTRSQAILFDDPHAKRACEIAYETEPNFSFIEHASTTEIGDGYVVCDVKLGMPRLDEMELLFGGGGHEGVHGGPRGMAGGPGGLGGPGDMRRRVIVPEHEIKIETRKLEFDSVVVSGGRTPRTEEAMIYAGLAPQFFIIGDNLSAGDIRNCTSTAFAAAMQI